MSLLLQVRATEGKLSYFNGELQKNPSAPTAKLKLIIQVLKFLPVQSDLFICIYHKLIKVNQYGFSIITKANITSVTGAIEKYSNCKFTEK